MTEKRCRNCKETKDIALFLHSKGGTQLTSGLCMDCRIELAATLKKKRWSDIEANRAKDREYARKRRLRVLIHYGGNPPRCACCNEDKYEFLQLDHIEGGGKQHRMKTFGYISGPSLYKRILRDKFPPGYRVLCANCNFALGHWDHCPHLTDKVGM